VFVEGTPVSRSALFLSCGQRQRSPLPERLGCRFTDKGTVNTGKCEATNVPGLYVAGDASKEAQFVVVAAAEGMEAGMAIHKALLEEDLP
jgi:thioredoxin reductase